MQFIDGEGNVTVNPWGGWQIVFDADGVRVSALGEGGFSAPIKNPVVANQLVNEFLGTWRTYKFKNTRREAGIEYLYPPKTRPIA